MNAGVERPAVRCAACGRNFKWKPELAGRTVKCPCGAALRVPPAERAEVDAGDDAGMYELAEPPPARPAKPAKPRATGARPAAPAVGLAAAAAGSADAPHPATAPALDRAPTAPPTPAALAVALPPQRKGLTPEPRVRDEEVFQRSTLRDLVVPAVLIAVGVALRFLEVTLTGEHRIHAVGPAVAAVAMKLALSVGLMLGGMSLAVQVMEVCFVGPLSRTAFKLVAIAVAPGALYGILTHAGGETYGSMLGTFASVAAFALLFWLLMRLDGKDTGVCVLVTWILITAANYAAYRAEGLIRDAWV